MKDGEVRDFGRRDKIGYMFGDFGNDFTFIFASSFLMVFYTKVLGISGGMVGDTVSGRTICGCIHGCDDGTHRRCCAAGAGWKVPMLDPQDVRTGGAVEFFDVPDCHGAGIYAVEDCLHVCYLSFVGKYFFIHRSTFRMVRWHLRSRRRHRSGRRYLPPGRLGRHWRGL